MILRLDKSVCVWQEMRLQGDRGRAVEVVIVIKVVVSSGQQRDSAIHMHQCSYQYQNKKFFFLKRTLLRMSWWHLNIGHR